MEDLKIENLDQALKYMEECEKNLKDAIAMVQIYQNLYKAESGNYLDDVKNTYLDYDYPVCLVFEDIEYTHVLTVLRNIASDFRYETLTHNELIYVHDALIAAHNNYIKLHGGEHEADK